MSSIITFYSYKGGVGRSMALANIAYELSKRKFKVLIVDWDLEAPGIERYFSSLKIDNSTQGLLQLFVSVRDGANPDYKDYLWEIDTQNEFPISLLHSGREKEPASYTALLQNFNWTDFFADKKGGSYLENLRTLWHNDFDFVLIDSRTGLSDSSGICTILMPDIIVPLFTANYQSLFGIRDIVKYIQTARQKLEVDRMALTVLPIPSRFGTRVEFKESQEWLERIADILKDCYSDWLPKWIEPKYILEQIKVPQIDYFSFGEKLAVLEQGTNDPESMGFIFSKIATLLSTDLSDIENFVGADYYQSRKREFELNDIDTKAPEENKFLYDVYLHYPKEVYQWVKELLIPALTEYLNDDLGYNPQLYFNISDSNLNESISSGTESAIQKSKTYIFVVTDSGLDNSFLNIELASILKREKVNKKELLFPILYSQTYALPIKLLPDSLKTKQFSDFSNYRYEDTVRSTKLRSQFGQEVEKLSSAIAQSINQKDVLEKPKSVRNRKDSINENFEEFIHLAKEYEVIRKKMISGDMRTRAMENIVTRINAASTSPTNFLPTLTESNSPGERLVAIANLQKFPNLKYLDWLAEHVGDSEKPFIGYQASVALYIASRTFGKENKKLFENILNAASANIQKHNYKDPNQVAVIKAALNEVQVK